MFRKKKKKSPFSAFLAVQLYRLALDLQLLVGSLGVMAEEVDDVMRLRAEERVHDVMWLRAVDKDIDAAKLVRVAVSESTTGRGSKRKTSFVCTGTLHKGKDDRMGEYVRAQKKVNTDPRCDGGLQLELQRVMMANFRKQKRQREADNLVDSEEEDDEGAHLCPPPSFLCCAHVPLAHSALCSFSPLLLSCSLSQTS